MDVNTINQTPDNLDGNEGKDLAPWYAIRLFSNSQAKVGD